MVGVVEHHDGLAAGMGAGDLDRVLDSLGTGVEQHGPLGVITRGEPVELFGDPHVALVGRDHEAGVSERRDLLADGVDDGRGAVADGGHGDAGTEVDELVAVRIDQDAAACGDDVDRQGGPDAAGHCGLLAGVHLLRDGSGNGCDEPAFLCDGRKLRGGHVLLLKTTERYCRPR